MTYVPQPTPLFVAAHYIEQRENDPDVVLKIVVHEVIGWEVNQPFYDPVIMDGTYTNGLSVIRCEGDEDGEYLRYSRDRGHWSGRAPKIVFADDAPPHEKAAL